MCFYVVCDLPYDGAILNQLLAPFLLFIRCLPHTLLDEAYPPAWEIAQAPCIPSNSWAISKIQSADVEKTMQLYHHPYSLDSQKVRLALEEKGIDYTSYHVNPLTGKNMDSSFFRMNPSAKLPVFQNGAHIIFDTIDIIQ